MPTEKDYLEHDIKYTLIAIEELKAYYTLNLAFLENDLKEATESLRKLTLRIVWLCWFKEYYVNW